MNASFRQRTIHHDDRRGCTGIAFAAPTDPACQCRPPNPRRKGPPPLTSGPCRGTERSIPDCGGGGELQADKTVQRARAPRPSSPEGMIAAAEAEADEARTSRKHAMPLWRTYSMKGRPSPAEMKKLKSDAERGWSVIR